MLRRFWALSAHFRCALARAARMSAMEASEFWDIAREAGYDDFQVLACVKREDLGRIFGDGAAEVALVEWEKGQMALEMALFQIGQDGLPMEPPAPSKHSYAAPMSMAQSVARKPFSLPVKWPVVAERVPLVSPGHVDISNRLSAIAVSYTHLTLPTKRIV